MSRRLLATIAGLLLASCATAPGVSSAVRLAPLELALAGDLAEIEAQASTGSAPHQLALGIIYGEGLRGRTRDQALAGTWTARALARRGWRPIMTYTAAFDGKPSRVGMVQVPRYDASQADVIAVARCVRALDGGQGEDAARACGGVARHERLRSLWRAAAG